MTSLEDLSLREVTCFECAKPVSTIPAWLAGAKIKFQCEECRQRHPRVPGISDIDRSRPVIPAEDIVTADLDDEDDMDAELDGEDELAD